jgi:uncharacterized repeat protein (TIGR01451 family)
VQNVTAVADGGIKKEAAATLEIFGMPTLQTKMADKGDPVEVGQKLIYTLEVINTGALPADKIEVTALIPPQLKFSAVKAPARDALVGNQINFDKVDGLKPGERLVYEFEMEAIKPGDARFRVQINSSALTAGPTFEEDSTTIIAPGVPPGGDMPPPPPPPKE